MSEAVTQWLKTGRYLPPFLRDFHDQKDVFKALDEVVQRRQGDAYTKGLSWISAQVYVIDVFLWMMARHGYTLQRTRAKLPFSDLHVFVDGSKQRRNRAFAEVSAGET